MRNATGNEIENALYVGEFCFDCRKWRDNPESKTQCKIAGFAAVGENYKNYWKTDNGMTYCVKYQSRKPQIKDAPKTELMKMME